MSGDTAAEHPQVIVFELKLWDYVAKIKPMIVKRKIFPPTTYTFEKARVVFTTSRILVASIQRFIFLCMSKIAKDVAWVYTRRSVCEHVWEAVRRDIPTSFEPVTSQKAKPDHEAPASFAKPPLEPVIEPVAKPVSAPVAVVQDAVVNPTMEGPITFTRASYHLLIKNPTKVSYFSCVCNLS